MPVSDTGDLLICSTRAHLRVQRHGPGPLHSTEPPAAPIPSIEPPAAPIPSIEPPAAPRLSRTPPPSGDEELQTIRLAAGGRGAGLEALRQRSQSAPCRRQVKVTLLGSHDAPGLDSNSHSAPEQDATSHNAPGQRYNCNMERVSELTESVQRLLHNYRGQALTEETLQRLETLHNQQLTLQNQLLDSALKMAMRPQSLPPAAVPMETLPVVPAPLPNRATNSSLLSDRAIKEAGLRAEEAEFRLERVLMEMESLRTDLKTVLSQREEPDEPLQPRATRSPSKDTRPKSPGTLKNPAGSRRVPPPQSQCRALSQPHRTRTPILPQTLAKSDRNPQINKVSAGLQPSESQSEDSEKLQNQWNQESRRDEPQGHHNHGNAVQYLQNGVKSEPSRKGVDGHGTEQFGRQEEKRDGGQGLGKENNVTSKHDLGLGLSGVRSGLQAPRRVLEGPENPSSILDEARLVLKKVQRRRKVLEENLESQLRARSGELLHCQLDALSQNRDCSDEIRIKKTVDSFIRDIQAEMEVSAASREQTGPKTSANRNPVGRRNPAPSGRLLRTSAKPSQTHLKPSVDTVQDLVRDPEDRQRRLYGKAAHDGQRRSLKKGPYLRLSSPVSPDRRPRPRLLQSVPGVKLKSCKTQTTGSGLELSPGLVRSGASFPAVAIPLGRPRAGPSHRAPSPPAPQRVTSPPRAPPSPQQQEVTSQSKASPRNDVTSDVIRAEDKHPEQSSDPPVVNILQSSPQQQVEEEVEFPGTNFLSVADLEQSEAGSEANPRGPEEVLLLEGGPSPDLVQYQGPDFPPRAPLPSPGEQNFDLGLNTQQDALEERLVQWVEQQVMSRIICDMLRPSLSDPNHSLYTCQSEPQHRPEPAHSPSSVHSQPSVSSDLNHRASSLQLQVDSGLDLDPEQVRGLILEVLTEIVALFLGSRESQGTETAPGPEPAAETVPTPLSHSEAQETLVPTPEATPPQTPPPAVQTPTPVAKTPPLSPVATPRATPSLPDKPSVKEDTHPEPVATPPPTPPVTCPDDDTPLVQTEEEPKAPLPPDSSPTPPVVAPPPGTPSPLHASPTTSSGSESTESSGTNITAPRHISEGELLLSLRHLQALHEETGSFSSSLHEYQEMELDPPSEGQILSSNIVLQFLNKMQQHEPRPAPEGAWGRDLEEDEEVSAGEIKGVPIEQCNDASKSPGQTSPVTGEALDWTNQSALSEGLLTSDLLDTPLAQVDASASAPKQSSDLGLNLDLDPLQTQESPPDRDLSLDPESPQRNGEDSSPLCPAEDAVITGEWCDVVSVETPQRAQRRLSRRRCGRVSVETLLMDGETGPGATQQSLTLQWSVHTTAAQTQLQTGSAEDGAGGVWGEGGPALVKMEVFVPSVGAAETSGGSDSSSDVF